jgi:hypothetical protein
VTSFFHAIKAAKTVEDFICAVADLGNPETGDVSDCDDQERIDILHAIIEAARRYQRPMDSDTARLLEALGSAEGGLQNPDKRSSALATVREALRR